MTKWGLILAPLALAAVLGVAACGSHHGPAAPTPPPSDGGGNGTGNPPPPPPPPPPTLGITRILTFGDSMTEGTTSAPISGLAVLPPPPIDAGRASSYAFKLQALETARYTAQTIQVFNGGFAGSHAKDDRDRLALDVRAVSPQVVLLMEGANDLNDGVATPNPTITATVNAMEDMVRDTTAVGVPVFLATLPPQRSGDTPPRGGAAAIVGRYNDALKVMAAKKGATLIDIGGQFPLDLIGIDGLHPTDAGYDFIAKIFQDAIAAKWEQAAGNSVR